MASLVAASDRRRAARFDVEIRAFVKILGRARIPCMVRNISPSGALLEFADAVALPDTFRLDIDDDLFEVDCTKVHYDRNRVGVEFRSNRQQAIALYG